MTAEMRGGLCGEEKGGGRGAEGCVRGRARRRWQGGGGREGGKADEGGEPPCLEEGAGEGLDGAGDLLLAAGRGAVEAAHAHVLLAGTLWVGEEGGGEECVTA